TTSQSLTNQINSASSKAQQALDEANKADGKIADYATRNNLISSAQADSKISDYVTRNGLVSGTTVDSKINTATGEWSQNLSRVESKVDNVKVGSRNLILNSNKEVSNSNYYISSYTLSDVSLITSNEEYTI